MNATLRPLLAAAVLAAAAGAASAAVVTVDFEVALDGGPLAGSLLAGSFAYDDAQAPGTNPFGDTTFALDSFSFAFGGTVYTEAAFDPLSPLLWTLPAGELPGLDGVVNGFSFTPGIGGFAPSFAYTVDAGSGFGSVRYTLRDGGTVPEPMGAALVLTALLGLAAVQRRG